MENMVPWAALENREMTKIMLDPAGLSLEPKQETNEHGWSTFPRANLRNDVENKRR